jgi:lipid-binding SYLF domain-containing protein
MRARIRFGDNTGGTCSVAAASVGTSSTYTGSYRLDQPADLAWLGTFGVS